MIIGDRTGNRVAHDEVLAFLGGRKPIVVTLRESDAQPARNSRLEEWLKRSG